MRLIATALVLAVLAVAQSRPDFSGEWKMNPAASDYGQMPAPQSLVRRIDHKDPKLHVVTRQVGQRGEVTTELRYTTDGKVCVNRIGNSEARGTAKWEGNVLHIDSTRSFPGGELKFQEEWSLAADGKTLTIKNHIVAPMREVDIKLVLDKQ